MSSETIGELLDRARRWLNINCQEYSAVDGAQSVVRRGRADNGTNLQLD